jgi:3',5'-cyclic AMP phosphodiesterase CpdA
VQYSVDLGPMRLVVVDTTLPGEVPGALDAERLARLDGELAAAPGAPTLVAMHHPAFATGVPAWDALNLPVSDRAAFAEVLGRYPQVQRVLAGHVHRTIAGQIAGRVALTVPSTYVQGRLTFAEEIEIADEPAGFALHAVVDGEVVSHVQPVL